MRNIDRSVREIPTKVSVNVRAMQTAGFAKKVDDVNQYPAVTVRATSSGTDCFANRDLPPINRATGKLVKSDIEGVVGHEEAVYG